MNFSDLEGLPGIIYLRKSRKDVEGEREAALQGKPYDTLDRHREQLNRLIRQHKMVLIDELAEIVSGEFISERPKMQKVLEYLEEGNISWVAVMDEDRLGRGDKIDQGIIEKAFKESETYIVTPYKIVDLQDEADEQYMDYKGMGARYEYKQTKKRLMTGRRESARKGNFVGTKPPFGYIRGTDYKNEYPHLIHMITDNPKEIENLKLYPHPNEAEIVKMIFEEFLSGTRVADILGKLDVLAPNENGTPWRYSKLHRILINETYKGNIIYGKYKNKKLENGTYTATKRKKGDPNIVISENAHTPLVSSEDFEKVQKMIKDKYNPPVNKTKEIINPMAGLIKCHYCGLALSYKKYSDKKSKRRPHLICKNFTCDKHFTTIYEKVEELLLEQIEEYYKYLQSDPDLIKQEKSAKNTLASLENKKVELNKKITSVNDQLDLVHELFETQKYDYDTFIKRFNVLTQKINDLNNQIKSIDDQIQKESEINEKKSKAIPKVRHVISAYYKAPTAKEKNDLLKSIIAKIYYDKPQKGDKFNLIIEWKSF